MRKTILDLSDAKELFDQLLTHWSSANQALSNTEIVLKGGYDRNAFLNAAVEFDHLGEMIDEAVKSRDRLSEQLILFKENMRSTMQRFGYLVRGLHADSEFARKIPALPDTRSNEDKFMEPVERTLLIWRQINEIQPLCLPDGTEIEAFAVGVNVIRQAFKSREKAFSQERYVRAIRRRHHQVLVDRAVQYRQVILGTFGEDSTIVGSMPFLWPKQDRTKKPAKKFSVVESRPMISEESRPSAARLA